MHTHPKLSRNCIKALLSFAIAFPAPAFAEGAKLMSRLSSSDPSWSEKLGTELKAKQASTDTATFAVRFENKHLVDSSVLIDTPDGSTVNIERSVSAQEGIRKTWGGKSVDGRTHISLSISPQGTSGFLLSNSTWYSISPTSTPSVSTIIPLRKPHIPEVGDKPPPPSKEMYEREEEYQRKLREKGPPAATAPKTAASMLDPIIDVMVVTTPRSRAVLQQTGVSAEGLVSLTSIVFANSSIAAQVRLVEILNMSFDFTGDANSQLAQYSNNSLVIGRRNAVGADITLLLSGDANPCGTAYLGPNAATAFGVVNAGCQATLTFTHELGHLFGADHDWEANPNPGIAHGWPSFRDVAGVTAESRPCSQTIMATNAVNKSNPRCTGIDGYYRMPYFSNPNIPYLEWKIGDSRWADNSRKIRETAATVAGFRGFSSQGNQVTPIQKIINVIQTWILE